MNNIDMIKIKIRQQDFSKMLSRLALTGLRNFTIEFGPSSTIYILFETSKLFDIIKDTKCFDYDAIEKLMSITFKDIDKWREDRTENELKEIINNSPEEEQNESKD